MVSLAPKPAPFTVVIVVGGPLLGVRVTVGLAAAAPTGVSNRLAGRLNTTSSKPMSTRVIRRPLRRCPGIDGAAMADPLLRATPVAVRGEPPEATAVAARGLGAAARRNGLRIIIGVSSLRARRAAGVQYARLRSQVDRRSRTESTLARCLVPAGIGRRDRPPASGYGRRWLPLAWFSGSAERAVENGDRAARDGHPVAVQRNADQS